MEPDFVLMQTIKNKLTSLPQVSMVCNLNQKLRQMTCHAKEGVNQIRWIIGRTTCNLTKEFPEINTAHYDKYVSKLRQHEIRAYGYVIPSKSEVPLHTHDDTTRSVPWNQILFRCINANHQEQANITASSGNGVT